jgi:hypothetical protein
MTAKQLAPVAQHGRGIRLKTGVLKVRILSGALEALTPGVDQKTIRCKGFRCSLRLGSRLSESLFSYILQVSNWAYCLTRRPICLAIILLLTTTPAAGRSWWSDPFDYDPVTPEAVVVTVAFVAVTVVCLEIFIPDRLSNESDDEGRKTLALDGQCACPSDQHDIDVVNFPQNSLRLLSCAVPASFIIIEGGKRNETLQITQRQMAGVLVCEYR